MAKPDIVIVDGHAFSWQRLCELRRQQLEEGKPPSLGSSPVRAERRLPSGDRADRSRPPCRADLFAAMPARRESVS